MTDLTDLAGLLRFHANHPEDAPRAAAVALSIADRLHAAHRDRPDDERARRCYLAADAISDVLAHPDNPSLWTYAEAAVNYLSAPIHHEADQ